MTEVFARIVLGLHRITAREGTRIQHENLNIVPVDHVTDCMDLFELCCGQRGLSNDKNQRLVIMSLREDRLLGYIRNFWHWPTTIILADGLTKRGVFPQLLRFVTTGHIDVHLRSDQFMRVRHRPDAPVIRDQTEMERHLEQMKT